MFDIGFLELMVIAIIGLLVLGPERLPKAARTAGLFLGRIRRSLNNIQDDLERQIRTEELREKLKDPYATFLDDDAQQADKTANTAATPANPAPTQTNTAQSNTAPTSIPAATTPTTDTAASASAEPKRAAHDDKPS
ncbi:twin-arginine translocase subunit TatB [Bacterioplanes sanyensis]|uniref:Sec-independent protein translocase protein TatB n=1 Tax=Bacterioplanes sanyensis TaxID=1249553 RepID=A0A222FFT5_9GAMM|nr:Sec-independent protein translocase protein TatB [Bacterioplanes sanyensis]ASP37609.1 twin-arginine translocase subunit TatB [Bacterioplanes sanyensis]